MDNFLFIKREKLKSYTAAKQVDCDDDDAQHLQEQYEEYHKFTGELPDHDAARVVEHVFNAANISASPVLVLKKDDKSY